MNDIWKIWQYVTPREGILALFFLFIASFLIHVMVMTASDRYAEGLLGAAGAM
jgi:hypothetical protein